MKNKQKLRGSITPALLIITGAFLVVIYGLLFILTLQFNYSHRQTASDMSIHIADAGVNYYRWLLSVDPADFTAGTGQPGPYEFDYRDPQGAVVGKYSLEIDPPSQSSQVVTITSTGWTNQYPNVKRRVVAQYGRISLTRFAFLHNSNIWFGSDFSINGPVFSNGGIRQDGTNTSTIESSRANYTCGLETGCNNPLEKPGIWGTGKLSELWKFPVRQIDFDSIKVDFNNMRSSAQTLGLYLAPSAAQGYRIVFKSDGDIDVYKVTGVSPIKGYSLENECENLYQTITSQTALGTYSLTDTPIIFAEDHVWVEGVVNGKTTVAAAQFPLGTFNANIWLTKNITFLAKDGNHKLGLVAERNIIIGRGIPNKFEVNGALLAQNGSIIRHHYNYFGCKSTGTDSIKQEFKFYGSLISSLPAYWNFSSGPQSPASGFQKTILDYDQSNFTEPPPFFPAYGGYEFLSWKEVKASD
jgi:hypothetical protein